MTRTDLDSFELALLAELRAEVASRAPAVRARRPFLRIGGPMAVAASTAVAVALAVVVSMQPAPAFAVERQADGDVEVTVRDWSDAPALERELEREGVTAEVTYDADATRPTELGSGGLVANCPAVGTVVVDHAEGGGVTFTLDAQLVAAHDELLVTAAGGRGDNAWAGVSVTWHGATC